MQNLKVIGQQDDSVILADDDGTQYTLALTEIATIRANRAEPEKTTELISPREVQGYIRAGQTAEDVAKLTGADIDYIKRFEGPILDEREFIVKTAQQTFAKRDPHTGIGTSFLDQINQKLLNASAANARWDAYRNGQEPWEVSLKFEVSGAEREAIWSFNPKTSQLNPANKEAETLDMVVHEEVGVDTLIPRLEAVSTAEVSQDELVDSQTEIDFNTASKSSLRGVTSFDPYELVRTEFTEEAPTDLAENNQTPETTAEPRGIHARPNLNNTDDLLEALRKRRGEREALPEFLEQEQEDSAYTGTLRTIRLPIENLDAVEAEPTAPEQPKRNDTGSVKKGRRGVPTWDEIVFGTKAESEE
ncbi:MAG: DUF3071 domain-containing protein [Microbacteriaceae bacterium]|nr:DUF3071 domain-containing protein [Microbacteriaceae bacterium]